MSLFNDLLPKISTRDIRAAIPESELLWRARSVDEWLDVYQRISDCNQSKTQIHTDAVSEVVREFIHGGGRPPLQGDFSTTTRLGLLLHSLHSLSSHLHHSLDYTFPTSDHGSYSIFMASKALSEETSILLQRWLHMCNEASPAHQKEAQHSGFLIIYHFVCLNQLASFPRIERMLWQRQTLNLGANSVWLRFRWKGDLPQILFHVGQVIRFIKDHPVRERPDWWPAAMHRAILAACACSLVYSTTPCSSSSLKENGSLKLMRIVAIDSPVVDNSGMQAFFDEPSNSIPALTCKDGTLLSLDHLSNVIDHCIQVWSETEPGLHATEWMAMKFSGLRELWKSPS